MVDSRWVLKISGYGMAPFRVKEIAQLKEKDEEEYYTGELNPILFYVNFNCFCIAFLWTSPELLRKPDEFAIRGSQKGDIYSFGIIMQEILFQSKPYFLCETLDAKGDFKPLEQK
jgi:serine/threonine protein kinase